MSNSPPNKYANWSRERFAVDCAPEFDADVVMLRVSGVDLADPVISGPHHAENQKDEQSELCY